MVLKAKINQSQVTLVHPNDPGNFPEIVGPRACTHFPLPLDSTFWIPEWNGKVMDSGFLVGETWILGLNLSRDSGLQGPRFWIPRPMILDSTSKHARNSGIWITLHGGYVDTGSRAADYLKEK